MELNSATLIVLLVVAALFFGIIYSEIKKYKKGKSSCSCGCSGCANAAFCHGKNKR